MNKKTHEVLDPIHVFIKLDSDERKVVDSYAFQRLRHISQLGLTYLVFPGATHNRFEHSLGVMELAGRVFDIVTSEINVHKKIKDILPKKDKLKYWRRVLRMAALCHDLGHLPFSHSAESYLPKGANHENITINIIKSDILSAIWDDLGLNHLDIIKLAAGAEKLDKIKFNDWEAILSEIITSNVFGVDRMDYLLRDSYYTGVVSGKFDHFRLIDTLRILPREYEKSTESVLGIEEGGLRCAEALLLARYFMFSQVYYHHVRRIYDIHLKDFLKSLYPEGIPVDPVEFLKITDNEVLVEILKALRDNNDNKNQEAKRILGRMHFKLLYQGNRQDEETNPNAFEVIFDAACSEFDKENLRHDEIRPGGGREEFPVMTRDLRIENSTFLSKVLNEIPYVQAKYIFASRNIYKNAKIWLKENKATILKKKNLFSKN